MFTIRLSLVLTLPVLLMDDSHEIETNQTREEKNSWEDETFSGISKTHSDSKNFQLGEVYDGKENFGGSLTGESTSKSSIEWRSSTILRDSETEYPFSSSSWRSSSNWESYALSHKYDEEVMFFDRISARKLRQTGSSNISSLVTPQLQFFPGHMLA